MTKNQRKVLLALNLRQMQMVDSPGELELGVFTREIAAAAGVSTRSAAVTLSQMREFRWVSSVHGQDTVGWLLEQRGVEALERVRDGFGVAA